MFACLVELSDALAAPGVWLDMPWVKRFPVVAAPEPDTRRVAAAESEPLLPEDDADSVVWSQHGCWNL